MFQSPNSSRKATSTSFPTHFLPCLILLSVVSCGSAQDKPPVIKPGGPSTPPSDAKVLFDGNSADAWQGGGGTPCPWKVQDGELICRPGTGGIVTKQAFGDAQIHVEFATPLMPEATGQGRGNSGVYVQGRYEVQILDSFNNETYPVGQCGAIYGQYAPLVNACRPPEEWQSYDIIFRAPRFDSAGKIVQRPRMTVFHNGVLIHDNVELKGICGGGVDEIEAPTGGLFLQDHGNLVKFRNIWIRPLPPPQG